MGARGGGGRLAAEQSSVPQSICLSLPKAPEFRPLLQLAQHAAPRIPLGFRLVFYLIQERKHKRFPDRQPPV
jgi:hypothetical protein